MKWLTPVEPTIQEKAHTEHPGNGKIPYALRIGKRSRVIGNQSISFSPLILGVLNPAALVGFMSMAVAVIAFESSELLAVVNGLRVAKSGL